MGFQGLTQLSERWRRREGRTVKKRSESEKSNFTCCAKHKCRLKRETAVDDAQHADREEAAVILRQKLSNKFILEVFLKMSVMSL